MEERLKTKNRLRVAWSKRKNDMIFHFPKDKCDAHLIQLYFYGHKYIAGKVSPSFIEELEKRNYDITTLRFSIAYKKRKKQ